MVQPEFISVSIAEKTVIALGTWGQRNTATYKIKFATQAAVEQKYFLMKLAVKTTQSLGACAKLHITSLAGTSKVLSLTASAVRHTMGSSAGTKRVI
jgi:hypothetical protein